MKLIPSIVEVQVRGGYEVRLVFNDGLEGTVDLSGWLMGPVFEPVRDLHYFQRLFVDGGAIAWPNGADIAPETLYEHVRSGTPA